MCKDRLAVHVHNNVNNAVPSKSYVNLHCERVCVHYINKMRHT